MKLRKASESVGWMDSEGPLTQSPRPIDRLVELAYQAALAHHNEARLLAGFGAGQSEHPTERVFDCRHPDCKLVSRALSEGT